MNRNRLPDSKDLVEKKEQQIIREFKDLLTDLAEMLRRATHTTTVYMYWVNKHRQQFVNEVASTKAVNAVFQDRIDFEDHFLHSFCDITEPIQIEVGRHIAKSDLNHYYGKTDVQYVTLIPFINKSETIAITALESEKQELDPDEEAALFFYEDALNKLLNTYLEVSNLSEDQQKWSEYEQAIKRIQSERRPVKVIQKLLEEINHYLPNGGALVASRGMDAWSTLLSNAEAQNPPLTGTRLEKGTIGYQALESGKAEFCIHFNGSPKRVAAREPMSNGATMAVPILVHDRRQALIMAYDENPLLFTESLKHKINNLCRICSLKLTASEPRSSLKENLFANAYSAFIPDIWEMSLKAELERAKTEPDIHTWFGLVTLKDLSSLRTRYRFDELKSLQKEIIVTLNPSNFGLAGYLGSKTDYVYTFLIQGDTPDTIEIWNNALYELGNKKIQFSNGREERIEFIAGSAKITPDYKNIQTIIKQANIAFSDAFKSPGKLLSRI